MYENNKNVCRDDKKWLILRDEFLKCVLVEGYQSRIFYLVIRVVLFILVRYFQDVGDVLRIGIYSEGGDICCLLYNWEMFISIVGNNNAVN